MNKATTNPIGTLVAGVDCVTRCEAFAACGGNRGDFPWATPCGCAWTESSGKRHKCEQCSLNCRERKAVGPNGPVPDFALRLNEGMLLDQVTVAQTLDKPFPLYIPTYTHELTPEGAPYPFSWAAADVRSLFNTRSVKPFFETAASTQKRLRVGPECNLIAVLNGEDSFLENFWAMKRSQVLTQLRASGFSIATGATFSVSDLTSDGTPMPYAHNVTMLGRHHRVTHETQAAGMEPVPNIYWVDGDQRELGYWAEWLMMNPGISTVSRDFSSTRDSITPMSKLRELIAMLNQTGRSFHVLIVGTGCKTGPLVLRALADAGHSGSIISASPVHAAFKNTRYHLDGNGRVVIEKLTDTSIPFRALIMHNMEVFEQALCAAVAGTAAGKKAVQNVLKR